MRPSHGLNQQSAGSPVDDVMPDRGERERILDAARSLLRRAPPTALTRAKIAHLADLHPEIVSRHFRNKNRLMGELDAAADQVILDA